MSGGREDRRLKFLHAELLDERLPVGGNQEILEAIRCLSVGGGDRLRVDDKVVVEVAQSAVVAIERHQAVLNLRAVCQVGPDVGERVRTHGGGRVQRARRARADGLVADPVRLDLRERP